MRSTEEILLHREEDQQERHVNHQIEWTGDSWIKMFADCHDNQV